MFDISTLGTLGTAIMAAGIVWIAWKVRKWLMAVALISAAVSFAYPGANITGLMTSLVTGGVNYRVTEFRDAYAVADTCSQGALQDPSGIADRCTPAIIDGARSAGNSLVHAAKGIVSAVDTYVTQGAVGRCAASLNGGTYRDCLGDVIPRPRQVAYR